MMKFGVCVTSSPNYVNLQNYIKVAEKLNEHHIQPKHSPTNKTHFSKVSPVFENLLLNFQSWRSLQLSVSPLPSASLGQLPSSRGKLRKNDFLMTFFNTTLNYEPSPQFEAMHLCSPVATAFQTAPTVELLTKRLNLLLPTSDACGPFEVEAKQPPSALTFSTSAQLTIKILKLLRLALEMESQQHTFYCKLKTIKVSCQL